MWKTGVLVAIAVAITFFVARTDDNEKPVYGKTGFPVNCRAYIQDAVDGYRTGKYSADDTMAGLERNCGINGQVWKDKRNI